MSQPTLPKGWRRATIEDVVRFDTDSLIPEPAASYTYVGLEHIESETGILIGEKKIAGASIRGQKFRFTNEHVLYGKLRPYLNKVALPYFNGICSTDIIPLQPKHNVVREYLAYWLRSRGFLGYARAHATGTKMPRLGPSQFLKAAIPLPPLPVQQRIVEIL
jgi:type I restriction enzyme S subunit